MRVYKKQTAEAILTRQIRDILRTVGYKHYKAWQGLGSEPGVSDIIGLTKEGQFFACEIKGPKGKLSSAQAYFLMEVKRSGGLAIVAHSVEDVIEGLNLQDRFIGYKTKEG